ncbi:hypothetical protein [Ferrovum myxofaciens]|uniref:Uncharacterized protein n=1 Tax=Ferrovum myxofaciens TaxID=416213 RepID=A0A9E6SXT5_9PROT|nr:hypothetical protein [Ferrovum myxofaciens]QKE37442.1 MAG: hypothetical protein HO273_00760 [Ferrovum myxofaciens]QWY75091.1 MAG: hypothetical protein JVY19_01180 [Ferrovum myxofaciens]QWY77827.1 MAG: hypothetical protein JZL65_01690 [Ferrovum myxofaciens]
MEEKRHRIASKREPGRRERLIERSLVMVRRVNELVEAIDQVEKMLEDCGALLNVSQPPISGKIGLRWWKMRGEQADREPVVVIWNRGRSRRFYPKRVEICGLGRKVKNGKGFALGGDITRDVVRVMVMGLKLRDGLLKSLMQLERAIRSGGVMGVGDQIEGWEVDVGYWRTVMGGRLDGRFEGG